MDANTENEDSVLKNNVINENSMKILDQDIVPPDGGWGWIIVFAAGMSQLCTMAVQQSFGLLFRDRFKQLGITSSEITIILNINLAMFSFIGLANGAIFKKFSFRKVAFFGSLVNAMALAFLSTMTSFYGILMCLSIFYPSGLGITMSANSLALNTYFKKKRRIAVGLCWTFTGLGPIIVPQIITILLPIYGVPGTVLLFSGFALNGVICSLLLQPVAWHTKKISLVDNIMAKEEDIDCLKNDMKKDTITNSDENITNTNREKLYGLKKNSLGRLFSSQYRFYDDDDEEGAAGIDVISTPATPMIPRANDGWFSKQYSSTFSLSSSKTLKLLKSNYKSHPVSMDLFKTSSIPMLTQANHDDSRNKTISVSEKQTRKENNETKSNDWKIDLAKKDDENTTAKKHKNQSLLSRIITALIIFFDLNLLRDYIFTNLMLGINFANFTEMNFAMLTPFILAEYGLKHVQIAIVLSVLGSMDVVSRLFISVIASKIKWDNRTFFLIGIGCMAFGRIILAHVTSFEVIIAVAVLIGFGKALRTIFIALVIPSHVPLSRLPAATGLQLIVSGIISLGLGPVVGWIRDICGNYTTVLHILNIMTYLTIISWTLEMHITLRRKESTISNNKK